MNSDRDTRISPDDEQRLQKLLQLSGRRERPAAAARARARAAAHEAWRAGLVATRWRTRLRYALPLAAAAALLAAVMLRPTAPSGTAAAPPVARIARGAAELRDPGGTATIASAGQALRAGSRLTTSAGATAVLSLDTGVELRVSSGTVVGLVAPGRVALGDGQIYVDAGKAAASIAIDTPAGVLRDVGTRFEVRVRGAEVRVRVRDGSVRLEGNQRATDAGAGQELVALPGGPPTVSDWPRQQDDWVWAAKLAPFDVEGSTLDAFLRWVEHEADYAVTFADPAVRAQLGTTVLHGSVNGLDVDEALATVLPACGLTHRRQGQRVVITRETNR